MISESIINVVLKVSKPEAKDKLIKMLLVYINNQYYYNDNKVSHLLEILVDDKANLNVDDINLQYIIDNPKLIKYDAEQFNIADVRIERVDNIDCVAIVSYKYLEKINEDRGDIPYKDGKANISFIDFPDMLKK